MMSIMSNPARTWALLTCAAIWAIIGLGVAVGVPDMPVFHTDFFSRPARIAFWWVPAALAVVVWSSGRGGKPALFLLFIAPGIRAGSYLQAWALWLTDHTAAGAVKFGWYYASIYLAMCAIVVIAAYLTRDDKKVTE